MALDTLNLTGITPEKFAVLQALFTNEFKGGNHTELTGTFIDSLATIDYFYDGSNTLSLSIEKIGRHLFRKPSVKEVIDGLVAFVNEAVGKGTTIDKPVAEPNPTGFKPKVPATATTTTTAQTDVDPSKTQEPKV